MAKELWHSLDGEQTLSDKGEKNRNAIRRSSMTRCGVLLVYSFLSFFYASLPVVPSIIVSIQ